VKDKIVVVFVYVLKKLESLLQRLFIYILSLLYLLDICDGFYFSNTFFLLLFFSQLKLCLFLLLHWFIWHDTLLFPSFSSMPYSKINVLLFDAQ
jgi:hypothetical protein